MQSLQILRASWAMGDGRYFSVQGHFGPHRLDIFGWVIPVFYFFRTSKKYLSSFLPLSKNLQLGTRKVASFFHNCKSILISFSCKKTILDKIPIKYERSGRI